MKKDKWTTMHFLPKQNPSFCHTYFFHLAKVENVANLKYLHYMIRCLAYLDSCVEKVREIIVRGENNTLCVSLSYKIPTVKKKLY